MRKFFIILKIGIFWKILREIKNFSGYLHCPNHQYAWEIEKCFGKLISYYSEFLNSVQTCLLSIKILCWFQQNISSMILRLFFRILNKLLVWKIASIIRKNLYLAISSPQMWIFAFQHSVVIKIKVSHITIDELFTSLMMINADFRKLSLW